MFTRYLLAALLALALALGGAGWLLKRSYSQVGQLKAEALSLREQARIAQGRAKRDRAISASVAQKNAAAAKESALLRLRLESALAANADWANGTVPQEVLDALK